MANRTDPLAKSVHGTNPQNLVEKILRLKIYNSTYWKEHCFALTAESLVDKAVQLNSLGGTYGGARKPTEFICLILKLLQLQPDKEIIVEFIKNDDYKYVRMLGAFYLRLVGSPIEVYQYLEPLYNDYRKLRLRQVEGGFSLTHVDELVDEMLHGDYLFDIALPRIPTRLAMVALGTMEPRISVLAEDFDEEALEAGVGDAAKAAAALEMEMMRETEEKKAPRNGRSRSRSRSREPRKRRSRSPKKRERDREFERGGGGGGAEDRKRRRSRSPRERGEARREERGGGRDRGGGREKDRPKERDRDRRKGGQHEEEDAEIADANALRAKLGLKPLK